MLAKAQRLFHTVRHLRPVQVAARLGAPFRRIRPDLRPAPAQRAPAGRWALEAWRAASMLSPTTFCFLNVRGEADWTGGADRLWTYNLHYFDDLGAVGAAERRAWHIALIERWIQENPPVEGPGWEPYCLSLRIANWCRFAWSGAELPAAAVQSLALQVRALRGQLEHHILGNHLWANAKALLFGGLFFEGHEAAAWLAQGQALMMAQLAEQILPDGGHFERSPMYHHILTDDLFELLEAGRLFPGILAPGLAQRLRASAAAMLGWARDMSPPDGEPAFFNDSTMGVAPAFPVLKRHAREVGIQVEPGVADLVRVADSGYVRAARGPALLLADVGEIGPDYLPAHAHADTLSCELYLHGRRALVNTGVSTYSAGPVRLAERGSAAHNTVVVDGADSSEVWSSFRVARRARPFGVRVAEDADALLIEGSHDGYRRLAGRIIHHRIWRLTDGTLRVEDRLEGRARTAEAIWRLHPSVSACLLDDGSVACTQDGDRFTLSFDGGVAELEASYWAPEFGRRDPTTVVRVRLDGRALTTRIDW